MDGFERCDHGYRVSSCPSGCAEAAGWVRHTPPSQPPRFPEIKEGLVVNPGDTVIFTVGPNELDTPQKVEDYYRRVQEVMPAGVKVILTTTRPTVIRRETA